MRNVCWILLALAACREFNEPKDLDGDGFTVIGGDCVDAPPGGETIGPDADEIWYDGVDQDCDAASDFDKDGDGQESSEHGGTDCWDDPDIVMDPLNGFPVLTAADVFLGAADRWYDGIDADCDGASDFDADGDGYDTADAAYVQLDGTVGDDCYDYADPDTWGAVDPATVHPDREDDIGDGNDSDCDGLNLCYRDRDGDGYRDPDPSLVVVSGDDDCDDFGEGTTTEPATDCDDQRAMTYPGAEDLVGDASDDDCDGVVVCYVDADADGWRSTDTEATLASEDEDCADPGEGARALSPTDCDDDDAEIHPGATETGGDGVDSDCDEVDDP